MRVEIKAKEGVQIVILDILFWRTNKDKRRYQNRKELIDTTCVIFWDGREISRGVAMQNPLDTYNKMTGRKIALTKALVNLRKDMNLVFKMREHIWKVFHQTFGRWN